MNKQSNSVFLPSPWTMIYRRGDKIMVLETGEVFTVFRDLAFNREPGILVENGCAFARDEVRPAGQTREKFDLAKTITPPDTIPVRPNGYSTRLEDLQQINRFDNSH